MVYSGFCHPLIFWQCSDKSVTGSFPVQDEPPISVLTSGFFGKAPSGAPAAALLGLSVTCTVVDDGSVELALVDRAESSVFFGLFDDEDPAFGADDPPFLPFPGIILKWEATNGNAKPNSKALNDIEDDQISSSQCFCSFRAVDSLAAV